MDEFEVSQAMYVTSTLCCEKLTYCDAFQPLIEQIFELWAKVMKCLFYDGLLFIHRPLLDFSVTPPYSSIRLEHTSFQRHVWPLEGQLMWLHYLPTCGFLGS